MSSIVNEEVVANSDEEDVFGPLDDLPILSSSESWHESSGSSTQSDEEEVVENESDDAQGKGESEQPSESELERSSQTQSKSDGDSLRRSGAQLIRTYGLSKASIIEYKSLLKKMHVDPDSQNNTWSEKNNVIQATVGLSHWNRQENDSFFTALARKGRDQIFDIAQHIKSKSPLEVSDYISFLDERLQGSLISNESLFDPKLPAAVEISEDLDGVLDLFAEYATIEEQDRDLLKAEKGEGSEFWIIDSNKAEEIEDIITSNTGDVLAQATAVSAGLFDVKNWIRLSEKVFMNPGKSRPDDNWKNIAMNGESPSITTDALAEFYDLTVDLVIRLMTAAHDNARDRLAKENRGRLPLVKGKDVRMALKTMGMKRNSFDYFVDLPRRLGLDVAHILNKKGKQSTNAYVPYDKVERILSRRLRNKYKKDSDTSSVEETENDVASAGESIYAEHDDIDELELSDNEGDDVVMEDLVTNDESGRSSAHGDEPNTELPNDDFDQSDDEDTDENEHQQLEAEQRLDEYNEYLDGQASRKEEARLVELLSCPAMDKLKAIEKESGQADTPTQEVSNETRKLLYKNGAELVDWRSEFVYQPEWETYGTNFFLVKRDIQENHAKRRRLL